MPFVCDFILFVTKIPVERDLGSYGKMLSAYRLKIKQRLLYLVNVSYLSQVGIQQLVQLIRMTHSDHATSICAVGLIRD